MRFLPDGINIPDELLWAQDNQRVVFFCGAGVSQASASLPDFNKLTKKVLDELGARPDNDARRLYEASVQTESDHKISGLVSADRVFGLLRRDFTDDQIERAVAESLRPTKDVDLSAHKTMLRLSTLPTGETRLVTTNFDRLFQRAEKRLSTSTRSNLPNLDFNEANWGVVHLHGVVDEGYSAAAEDGFVLSSASFGDAYLSHGWARDFVKKVLENYIAVFIGYSADDPPMRYLLEGMQHNTSPHKAYAFQAVPNDQARIAWDEKGVVPIPFDVRGDKGYDILWETLAEWGKRTKNPRAWRERVIAKSRKGPRKLSSFERGMVAHLVRSKEGARAFVKAEPALPADWLCVFDPIVRYGEPGSESGRYSDGPKVDPFSLFGLDDDLEPRTREDEDYQSGRMPQEAWNAFDLRSDELEDIRPHNLSQIRGPRSSVVPPVPQRISHLMSWIIKTADHPPCVWWASRQTALHPEIIERVQWQIERKRPANFLKVVVAAWRAIIEYDSLKNIDRDRGYTFQLPEKKTGFHEHLTEKFIRYYQPHLGLQTSFRSPIPPRTKRGVRIRDLVQYDIEYPKGVLTKDIPDSYLQIVLPRMRQALLKAWDMEDRYSYYSDIVSIEPDKPREDEGDSSFHRGYEMSGHALYFVKAFKRFTIKFPEQARIEFLKWPNSNPLFNRLRIWALGNLDLMPASEFADALLAMDTNDFWPFKGNRDLLLGMKKRWNDIEPAERKEIEDRIVAGPVKVHGDTEQENRKYKSWAILNRLHWLHRNSCKLSLDLEAVTQELKRHASEWSSENIDRVADSNEGGGGVVRVEEKFDEVGAMAAEKIISHIRQMETRPIRKLVEYNPFLGLSREQPMLALEALRYASKGNDFPSQFWSMFLRSDVRADDQAELTMAIAEAVNKLSNQGFDEVLLSFSSWFEKRAPIIRENNQAILDAIWNRCIRSFKRSSKTGGSSLLRNADDEGAPDWITEAINSASGNLAQYLDQNRGKESFEKGEGLPEEWKQRAETLLKLKGDRRRYAIAVLCHNLHYLFYVDPEWTKIELLSAIDGGDERDEQAFWAGFFWAASVPSLELYQIIKEPLLKIARQSNGSFRRFNENLSGILLAGWNSYPKGKGKRLVSSEELRAIILDADEEFRRFILWNLERFSKSEKSSIDIVEFLQCVWPKQKIIRTKEISARLVELAFAVPEKFPIIVQEVVGLVSTVGDDRLFIPELRSEGGEISERYPDELLDLLYKILPVNSFQWPYGAEAALRNVGQAKPSLRANPKYIELESRTS